MGRGSVVAGATDVGVATENGTITAGPTTPGATATHTVTPSDHDSATETDGRSGGVPGFGVGAAVLAAVAAVLLAGRRA